MKGMIRITDIRDNPKYSLWNWFLPLIFKPFTWLLTSGTHPSPCPALGVHANDQKRSQRWAAARRPRAWKTHRKSFTGVWELSLNHHRLIRASKAKYPKRSISLIWPHFTRMRKEATCPKSILFASQLPQPQQFDNSYFESRNHLQ